MGEAGFPRPFGDYLLLSSFGRGGMGEVFLAKRTAFEGVDRLCVIKTLRGDLAEDPEYINRFLDEARVVVQLHHATICQVFDAGMVGTDYFMAMEYISGTNLRDLGRQLVQAGTALEPGIALYLLSETLDALAYAHRLHHAMTGEKLGIIHRDVSPHNVMLSFEGEVKLIDFGLAESTLKQEHTESAIVLGKVAYMSPEQARGEPVDASCDQFAAAVMGYELLTHERFYGTMKTHEIWQLVGRGGFVPRLFSTLDPEVQQILSRGWDAVAAQRYPSCEAMREAIDDFRALRYPRVGKKQARALMQSLYQQRIHEERRMLASFAELSSPHSARDKLAYWEARSTSQVATHGVASTEEPGPVEMTMSSSSSGPATTRSELPAEHVDDEPSASVGTLTRQEQAFVDAASRPDATMRVDRDGHPMPPAGPSASKAMPVAAGVAALALAAVVVVLVTQPGDPPATPGDAVLTDPSPAVTPDPAQAASPSSTDAGAADDVETTPEPAVVAATDTAPPSRGRRVRRRRAAVDKPVKKPDPPPVKEPEKKPDPPPEKKPEKKPDPPPVNKPPPPLKTLSTNELRRRLEQCTAPRAKQIQSLPKYQSANPADRDSVRTLIIHCLENQCAKR